MHLAVVGGAAKGPPQFCQAPLSSIGHGHISSSAKQLRRPLQVACIPGCLRHLVRLGLGVLHTHPGFHLLMLSCFAIFPMILMDAISLLDMFSRAAGWALGDPGSNWGPARKLGVRFRCWLDLPPPPPSLRKIPGERKRKKTHFLANAQWMWCVSKWGDPKMMMFMLLHFLRGWEGTTGALKHEHTHTHTNDQDKWKVLIQFQPREVFLCGSFFGRYPFVVGWVG